MISLFRRFKTPIFVVVIIAVFFIGRNSQATKIKSLPAKQVSVENRIVSKTISATGKVESPKFAELSFPITQRINEILVKKNDKVTKGQLLATLDNLSLANTAQQYKDARDVAINQRALFEKNKESEQETLGGEKQYLIRLNEYNEEISKAQAQYQANLSNLNNAYLYAPYDGTVVDVTKKTGETVTAGDTVVKLADITDIEFKVQIDQEDFGGLEVGMSADIELDTYPDEIFKARLTWVSDYADGEDSASFEGVLTFDDTKNKKILVGMTGDAKIYAKTTNSEVPSLYYDEIFTDKENKPYVWVNDNGYIKKLNVEIGLEGDIYTELKSTPDKQLLVPFNSDIDFKEGYKAKILK